MFHSTKVHQIMLVLTFGITSFIPQIYGYELRNEIVVPSEEYATIQAAIDAATDGMVIRVMPGIYNECITIRKPLSLLGSGINSTIINNIGKGNTISIEKEANNVLIRNFTIRCSQKSMWSGIYIRGINNTVENNFITGHRYGIYIYDSSNNCLKNNVMANNTYNFGVWGLYLSHFIHEIDPSNLVDGKPVLYWVNQENKQVPIDVGYVALVNSSGIIVKDLNVSNNLSGVLLAYTNKSLITNVNASKNSRGLYMVVSNNNTVVMNSFCDNEWSGISTVSSSNNVFVGNNISSNGKNGIRLSHSYYLLNTYSEKNSIIENVVTKNREGLYLEKANKNKVVRNKVTRNFHGIVLDESSDNVVEKNVVEGNEYGLYSISSHDKVFHNSFIGNTIPVYIQENGALNTWDDGFPSGGNYWSDYNGIDISCGVSQNETGSDGLGDTIYIIDPNNIDHYPLMAPLTTFNVNIMNGVIYTVDIISNFSISNFEADLLRKTISFNVIGEENKTGFCRIAIPNLIVENLWHGNYTVLLNGEPWAFQNWTDMERTYIYVNYVYSEHQITIIPEFKIASILQGFLLLFTIIVAFNQNRLRRQ